MKVINRNQVRKILLARGFRQQDFDEAYWPDEFVERFLKDPEAGIKRFIKQSGIINKYANKLE
jgi:hypothetical protein